MTPSEIEAALRSILDDFCARSKVTHPTAERDALNQEWNNTLDYVRRSSLVGSLAARVGAMLQQEGLEEAAKHADCCVDREERDRLRAALEGLGVKPDGYCFCLDKWQVAAGHTGECLEAQAALAPPEPTR